MGDEEEERERERREGEREREREGEIGWEIACAREKGRGRRGIGRE
jgi:hypothetical protein